MRKLIIWNLMTLDGYFEGKSPWDLDYHQLAWGEELRAYALEISRQADLLVFGRKTYEGMAAHWVDASEELEIKAFMNAIAKIVVSRSLDRAAWNNTSVVRDIVGELTRLKAQPGKDIFVFGSADLTDGLLKAGAESHAERIQELSTQADVLSQLLPHQLEGADLDLEMDTISAAAPNVTEQDVAKAANEVMRVKDPGPTLLTEVECPACSRHFEVRTDSLPGLSRVDLEQLAARVADDGDGGAE